MSNLHFHAPCFDGIASAVVALDYLEGPGGWSAATLWPQGNDARVRWLETHLPPKSAVVDFPYHPDAEFWADHHQTAFLAPSAEAHFRRREGASFAYDAKADSCAGVLWRHFEATYGHRTPALAELVRWAEKIDAARYDSVDEALHSTAPAVVIAASLGYEADDAYVISLVRALRTDSLDAVAAQEDVRHRFARVRELQVEGLDRMRASARLYDGIVVFDVDATGVEVNRYSPYESFATADYSIGIVRDGRSIKITAMRNPWKEFESVPLGLIFRRHGGGGHQRVASLYLPTAEAARAPELLRTIVGELRSTSARGE